jgi:hypothetical protein
MCASHAVLPTSVIKIAEEPLLPPSVDEWLPEKHLARFVVEVAWI